MRQFIFQNLSKISTIHNLKTFSLFLQLIIYQILIVNTCSIQLVQMIPLPSQQSNKPIAMYNTSNSPQYNSSFIQVSSPYNCSLSILYTVQQSTPQLLSNSPYNITLINVTQQTTVSITSVYKIISPTINDSSAPITLNPNQLVILQIRNGCPVDTSFFNYFDRAQLKIQGLQLFSYSVICNSQFVSNTLQIGLLIIIFLSTILITIVAIYSKAWSIGGRGFTINYPFIIVFGIILIIGGIVAVFSIEAVNIVVQVLSWIVGTFAVALCFNEVIFLIKLDFLRKGFKVKGFDIRVMEGISFTVGLGCCFGWYFSQKNWIVNDLVAVCMVVASIKLFKITSLKLAIIGFISILVIQIIFILILQLLLKISYNNAILNFFNNPFQIQVPTINAVYNQKCSWIPITAVAYPGAIMAYMRRFDSSRNTNVYLVTCSLTFLIGSVLWIFISIASPFSIPFGLLAEPAMCGLIAIFAWKRKQIRTLWNGKFYDQQYANKQALKNITQMIDNERQSKQMTMKKSLFQGLYIAGDQSCMEPSQIGQRRPRQENFKKKSQKIGIQQQ